MVGDIFYIAGLRVTTLGLGYLMVAAWFMIYVWVTNKSWKKKTKENATVVTALALAFIFGFGLFACTSPTTCTCGGITVRGEDCRSDPYIVACEDAGCRDFTYDGKTYDKGCGAGFLCDESSGNCYEIDGGYQKLCYETGEQCDSTKPCCSSNLKCMATSTTKKCLLGETPYVDPTPDTPTFCDNGWLTSKKCDGRDLLQMYRYSNCDEDWRTKRTCSYKCVNSECIPDPDDDDDEDDGDTSEEEEEQQKTDSCGNRICQVGESCDNCHSDCACESTETCDPTSALADSWGCVDDEIDAPVADPVCGDGACNGDDTCLNCEEDCGSCIDITYCGDGTCQSTEFADTCPEDCSESKYLEYLWIMGIVFVAGVIVLLVARRKGGLKRVYKRYVR